MGKVDTIAFGRLMKVAVRVALASFENPQKPYCCSGSVVGLEDPIQELKPSLPCCLDLPVVRLRWVGRPEHYYWS